MAGVPVRRVSSLVWGIAGLFAAHAAILDAGTRPFGPRRRRGRPVAARPGLAAAMVGGLRTSHGFAGGVVLGA